MGLQAVTSPRVVEKESTRLTVKEVCDIIDKCNSAKVSSLSFRDLSLTFGQFTDEQPRATRDGRPALTPDQELERQRQQQATLDVARAEELSAIENDLEQLKVTDPVKYEELAGNDEVE